MRNLITRAVWWVRYRTINRRHIINISGMDGYDKGWIDKDRAMFLACFKLLCDFVEREDPQVGLLTLEDYCDESYRPEGWELEHLERQIREDQEIRAIYNWWKNERRPEIDRAEKILEELSEGWMLQSDAYPDVFQRYNDAVRRLEERDNEMLEHLIRIRHRLWT